MSQPRFFVIARQLEMDGLACFVADQVLKAKAQPTKRQIVCQIHKNCFKCFFRRFQNYWNKNVLIFDSNKNVLILSRGGSASLTNNSPSRSFSFADLLCFWYRVAWENVRFLVAVRKRFCQIDRIHNQLRRWQKQKLPMQRTRFTVHCFPFARSMFDIMHNSIASMKTPKCIHSPPVELPTLLHLRTSFQVVCALARRTSHVHIGPDPYHRTRLCAECTASCWGLISIRAAGRRD